MGQWLNIGSNGGILISEPSRPFKIDWVELASANILL